MSEPVGFRAAGIPRMGALSPEDERAFQSFMAFDPSVRDWRNAFSQKYGEQPRTEGGDYDYRAAYAAGARPQTVPGDSIPHWSSVGKAEDHPTMWKQHFMEQFGVDPDLQAGQGYTPEMQDFIRRSNVLPAFSMPKGLF